MKILIVEDEIKTAQALLQGFEEQGFTVDLAHDGQSAIEKASEEAYQVIISDVILPFQSGLEFLAQIRSQGNQTPFLLLTALNRTDDKVIGLEIGADDYVVKPFEFQELLARTRALARRSMPAELSTTHLLRFEEVEMNLDAKICTRSGKKIDLTPKEFAFMEYLIRNKGRVVSKAEIAEKVWDIHFDTGTNVIEVYVNYLRNKIDKPFDQKIIHTVFGVGYVLKVAD